MELSPIAALTKEWHGYIVASEDSHAWALDLYRAGERHPETVDDYFPVEHAPWPWLRAAMEAHRDDETKHDRMYERAILRLGGVPESHEGEDVFNVMIRNCTEASFRIDALDDAPARRLKVAHFLAHAHFLEKRIARSLRWHLAACHKAGRTHVAHVVDVVGRDEARHAEYTLSAVHELLPAGEAARVLAVHRRGERRASLRFNARQLRTFFARFPDRVPRHRAAFFAVAGLLMEGAASRV